VTLALKPFLPPPTHSRPRLEPPGWGASGYR
jgi:hypothetical protein